MVLKLYISVWFVSLTVFPRWQSFSSRICFKGSWKQWVSSFCKVTIHHTCSCHMLHNAMNLTNLCSWKEVWNHVDRDTCMVPGLDMFFFYDIKTNSTSFIQDFISMTPVFHSIIDNVNWDICFLFSKIKVIIVANLS